MKRTEKEIYDFVKKKLDEAKDRLSYLISVHPHFDEKEQSECLAKIESYEEVLNFIGTVRTGKEKKIVGTTTVDKAFEKFFLDNCPEVKKKLEALEVLKKKTVNVKLIKTLGSLEEYNNMHADSRSKFPELAQDEFALLKEIFS